MAFASRTPTSHPPAAFAGQRIGLLGGSFNPAHDGHLHLSTVALKRLGLDAVWWLVSPQNPLKPKDKTPPLDTRMAQAAAIANHPSIYVTGLEQSLGTQYTVHTLDALCLRYPQVHFVWLMGADNFLQLPQWKSWERIMTKLPVAVFARPGYHLRAGLSKAAIRFNHHRLKPEHAVNLAIAKPPAWTIILGKLNPLSSTALRSA